MIQTPYILHKSHEGKYCSKRLSKRKGCRGAQNMVIRGPALYRKLNVLLQQASNSKVRFWEGSVSVWAIAVDWKMFPQKIAMPKSLEPVHVTLYGKNGGREVFADVIKDFEINELFWIIWLCPKCSHMYSYKRNGDFSCIAKKAI